MLTVQYGSKKFAFLFLLILWNLKAETLQHSGSMAPPNWNGLGYWIVTPENGEYGNWSSRDYMILVDSIGKAKWFQPNMDLLKFHKDPEKDDSIKKPPPPPLPIKKMVMKDSLPDSSKIEEKKPDDLDPRLWGPEELEEALNRLGADRREDKVIFFREFKESLPEDDRVRGVEEVWDVKSD